MSGVFQQAIFVPPWREVKPDGSLGKEYGPSPSTAQRRFVAFRNWAWKPQPKEPRDAQAVHAFMTREERPKVSEREAECYWLVYCELKTERAAAKTLGISRNSVSTYLKRLRKHVEAG